MSTIIAIMRNIKGITVQRMVRANSDGIIANKSVL